MEGSWEEVVMVVVAEEVVVVGVSSSGCSCSCCCCTIIFCENGGLGYGGMGMESVCKNNVGGMGRTVEI